MSFLLLILHLLFFFLFIFQHLKISSGVRHKARPRDEMWWIPCIEDMWITRMPADHACHTITGADEMNEECGKMVELSWQEKLKEPEKTLLRFLIEWSRRKLGNHSWRRATYLLRQEAVASVLSAVLFFSIVKSTIKSMHFRTFRDTFTFRNSSKHVKLSTLQTMNAHGDVEEVEWLTLNTAVFTQRKPRNSFYRMMSGSLYQCIR